MIQICNYDDELAGSDILVDIDALTTEILNNSACAVNKFLNLGVDNNLPSIFLAGEQHDLLNSKLTHFANLKALIEKKKNGQPLFVSDELLPCEQEFMLLIRSVPLINELNISRGIIKNKAKEYLGNSPDLRALMNYSISPIYAPYAKLCLHKYILDQIEKGHIDSYAQTDHPRDVEDNYLTNETGNNYVYDGWSRVYAKSRNGVSKRNKYSVEKISEMVAGVKDPIVYDMQGAAHVNGANDPGYECFYSYQESKHALFSQKNNCNIFGSVPGQEDYTNHDIPDDVLAEVHRDEHGYKLYVEYERGICLEDLACGSSDCLADEYREMIHQEKEIVDGVLEQMGLGKYKIDNFKVEFESFCRDVSGHVNIIADQICRGSQDC